MSGAVPGATPVPDHRRQMATSFGEAATAYEQGRPTYPAEAIAWLLADRPTDIVDLGAGTGKLTRALLGPGRTVRAIDPDPNMLSTLTAALPGVESIVGSAETIPLADRSADLMVLGQAWHWVDIVSASAEAGRVLRPGGTLGLIWNIRDERTPWVAEMSQIVHWSAAEQLIMSEAGPQVGAPFGDLETFTITWQRPMTRALLLGMVHSRSSFITADPATRATIESRLAELFDSLPALRTEEGEIALPYVTHAFRTRRP